MPQVGHIELYQRLRNAVRSGKYMITVSYVGAPRGKKKVPQVLHYFLTEDFPREDIFPTLNHYAGNLCEEAGLGEEDGDAG
jgi:hypothetical protein